MIDFFSKPTAQKVRNVREHPEVMMGIGEPDEEWDVEPAPGGDRSDVVGHMMGRPSAAISEVHRRAIQDARVATSGLLSIERAALDE